MASDPPGWYLDPRRPGIRRYWDGDHWIDVDQVAEDRVVPAEAPAPPSSGEPRLITQRRPDGLPVELGSPEATGEPEPLQD
jgi:Protein of unknown function (DUF2510)